MDAVKKEMSRGKKKRICQEIEKIIAKIANSMEGLKKNDEMSWEIRARIKKKIRNEDKR